MDANVRPRSLCETKLHPVETKNCATNNGHATRNLTIRENGKEDPLKLRVSWPNSSTATSGAALKLENPANYPVPLIASDRTPSMAGLLNTTVPQRLVIRPNRHHHTPTRHSLRHSRMISLIQQGKVPRKYLPRVIHRYKFGTCLAIIQIILGLLLIALALFFLLWSPTLNTPLIPHWSGIPLILSGLFATFLLCCCRKQYPGLQTEPWTLIAKTEHLICSVILAVIATIVCLSASTFASIHVSQLFQMTCDFDTSLNGSVELKNSTCTCNIDSNQFLYDGLTCSEVKSELPTLLLISTVANILATLVSIGHIFLLWNDWNSFSYAGVNNGELKTATV